MTRSCRWTPLGPIGLVTRPSEPGKRIASGRVTAIAAHPTDPDVIYVGTAGGGVWRTTNRGQVWKPLLDRGESLAIGAIAIDPSHPDRVFVGTGEGNDTDMALVGVGLLITEDGGTTWARVVLGAERTTRIVVSPAGDRVFLASTSGTWEHRREHDLAGTYATSTWTQLTQAWTTDLVYDDIADRLYMALRGDGVYVSEAGGAPVALGRTGTLDTDLPKPETVGTNSRIELAWVPAERQTLFALYTRCPDCNQFFRGTSQFFGIFRTDDAGGTWKQVAARSETPSAPISLDNQADYNLAFARNPSRPTDLLLGINRIWRSEDLGDSFQSDPVPAPEDGEGSDDSDANENDMPSEVHPDQHAFAVSDSGDIWLGNDGGVWLSLDAGATWSHRNRGLATMQFYAGALHADLAGVAYAASQDNGSQFYNGHPVWLESAGGDAVGVAIDSEHRRAWMVGNVHENTGAVVAYSNRLDEHESAFSVLEWNCPSGASNCTSDFPYTHIALAPSASNIAYIAFREVKHHKVRLYRTDSTLEPWLLEVPEYADVGDRIVALAVSPEDPQLLYVADGDKRVYQVEYAPIATTVTVLPDLPSLPSSVSIRAIAVSPRDSHRVYAAIGETDGSTSRAATSRLYRWDGGTNTWTDLTPGLVAVTAGSMTVDPRANAVHAVAIDPDPSITDPAHERLYIGCDRGVFESKDGGQSWRAIHDGLPLTPVFDLAFHQAERTLRAFTHGRGAWERAADIEPCAAPPGSPEVDLYVRDMRYDDGIGPSDPQAPDPVRRDGRGVKKKERRVVLRFTDAPDLKIDRQSIAGEDGEDDTPAFQTPGSTTDYTPNGALDCIGIETLVHRTPRKSAKARVYLQVHNRGPDTATSVTVRAFFANAASNGTWPDLPSDFWTSFPAADPGPGSAWKAVGPAQTIPEIRPAEPEVVRWEWDVPGDVADTIGILAVVTSADDSVFEGTAPAAMHRTIEPLVRTNKRICLKRTDTTRAAEASAWQKVGKVLEYVGIGVLVAAVAAGAAYGLYEGYEALEH